MFPASEMTMKKTANMLQAGTLCCVALGSRSAVEEVRA